MEKDWESPYKDPHIKFVYLTANVRIFLFETTINSTHETIQVSSLILMDLGQADSEGIRHVI
jgi:hypothetical protein